MDPFSHEPHVTWAIYSIALALIAVVVLLAETIADRHRAPEGGSRCKQ